ncbi:MAG TPA: ABC transporter permease [Acidimicrobiia bacterium]
MRAALTIGRNDLRQRLRDRSALVVGVIAPIILVVILSVALGGRGRTFSTTYAVVDLDHSALSHAFTAQVLQGPDLRSVIKVRRIATAGEARRQAHDGHIGAAFVIPAGFSEAVAKGGAARLTVIRSASSPIGAHVATAIATDFTTQLASPSVAADTAVRAGARRDAVLEAAVTHTPATATISSALSGGSHHAPSYYGPGIAILLLFLTVGSGARSIVNERNNATLARLLAGPISRPMVLIGKSIATFVLGVVTVGSVALVSGFALDAPWGDPLGVAALILAIVAAAVGLTMMLVTFVRTGEQADAYTVLIGLLLALLGGTFSEPAQLPALVERTRLLTPTGWALKGFSQLAGGGGLSTVALNVVAILAFAAVTAAVGFARVNQLARP